MSSTGTDAGVKADTGYATPVIGYLWRKYRTQLINRVRGYEGFRIVGNAGEKALAEHVGLCLFAAFWYMHIYPTVDAISGWEFGKRTGRLAYLGYGARLPRCTCSCIAVDGRKWRASRGGGSPLVPLCD